MSEEPTASSPGDGDRKLDELLARFNEGMQKVCVGVVKMGNEATRATGSLSDLRNLLSYALTGSEDTPSIARLEKRCIKAPLGCGQDLLKEDGTPKFDHFPNRETAELYEREWEITGMCPTCQDKLVETAEQYDNEDPCGDSPCTCQPF